MTAVTAQALQAALKEASPEALAYVCRELDCHPGENDKEKLIVSLMDWVCTLPLPLTLSDPISISAFFSDTRAWIGHR